MILKTRSQNSFLLILIAGCAIHEAFQSPAPCQEPKLISQVATYNNAVTCSKEHIFSSLRGGAPCQPRDKVVRIPWPNNTFVDHLTPTHVTVLRCSGGCSQLSAGVFSCVASRTRTREVEVLLGRCPVSGGQCEKECTSVVVEDEVECACGCRTKPGECLEELGKEFNSATCECECSDKVGVTSCLDIGRIWDSSQCVCLCPPVTCLAGQTLDENKCSCIGESVITSVRKAEDIKVEIEMSSVSLLEDLLHWEYILLMTLAVMHIVLLIIIAILVRRNNILKRQIPFQAVVQKAENNIYSSCPSQLDKQDLEVEIISDPIKQLNISEEKQTSPQPSVASYFSDSDYKSDNNFYISSPKQAMYGGQQRRIAPRMTQNMNYPLPEPQHTPHSPYSKPNPPSCFHTCSTNFPTKNLSSLKEDSGCEEWSLLGRETPM